MESSAPVDAFDEESETLEVELNPVSVCSIEDISHAPIA